MKEMKKDHSKHFIIAVLGFFFLFTALSGCLGGQGGKLITQSKIIGTLSGYLFVPSSVATELNKAPFSGGHSGPLYAISPPSGYAPLKGATISIVGINRADITDDNGHYSLNIFDNDGILSTTSLKANKTVGTTDWNITFEVSIDKNRQNNSHIVIDGTSANNLKATVITVLGDDSTLSQEVEKRRSDILFDNSSNIIDHDYFPMAASNSWTFHDENDTEETRTVKAKTGEYAPDIAGHIINWFWDTGEITIKLAKDKEKNIRVLYSSAHPEITPSKPGIIMPHSPSVGNQFYPLGTQENSFKVTSISTDNKMIMPAGTFENILKIQKGSQAHYLYFAHGIGLIKEETDAQSWVLKSAKIDGINYPPTAKDLVLLSVKRWAQGFENKDIDAVMREYDSHFESDMGDDKFEMKAKIEDEFFDNGDNIKISYEDFEIIGSTDAQVEVTGNMDYMGTYKVELSLILNYKLVNSQWKIVGKSILWQDSYDSDKNSSLNVSFDPKSLISSYEIRHTDIIGKKIKWNQTDSNHYHYIRVIRYPDDANTKTDSLTGSEYTFVAEDFGVISSGSVYLIIVGSKFSASASDGQYAEYQKYFLFK